jgi:hypothetical protein
MRVRLVCIEFDGQTDPRRAAQVHRRIDRRFRRLDLSEGNGIELDMRRAVAGVLAQPQTVTAQ